MSIFLEVLSQTEVKLKQMSQQVDNIRWMAENGRYDAALEHALRLEYNSERLTLLTRALPGYTGNPLAKAHVEKAIREAVPVEVGYTAEGWFSLRLPLLLPKKEKGSTEFIRGFLYPSMGKFFQGKDPVRYPDAVMIFRHVYSRDRPERERRDHDNIEVNIVADMGFQFMMSLCRRQQCCHITKIMGHIKTRATIYILRIETGRRLPRRGIK